jgi:Na+/H+ antiporter NhaA
MRNWLRLLTYALAALCGIGAVVFPAASSVLVPVATGLAGWATIHPTDVATAAGLADLAKTAAEVAVSANTKK